MGYRLKDRNKQIPHGLRFLQPETNWRPQRFASFSTIVQGLISHRRRHSDLAAKNKWNLDVDSVSNEVDEFNAAYCVRMGWLDYVQGSDGVAPPPKPQALLAQERNEASAAAGRAKLIWTGVRTLNDWIDSGTPPVATEKAEARALACSKCPKNGAGDFTSWFTKPAAAMITHQLERLKGMKLSTPYDDKINICEVCLCPLKLKVHTPISFIRNHLTPEIVSKLGSVKDTSNRPYECWIAKEIKQ